jgi:hypothetical protein
VQPKYGIHLGLIEHPFLHHKPGPTFHAGQRTLLSGLKNKLDRARQVLAHLAQYLGCAQQHSHVGVVAAGVHHAHRLAQVHGLDGAGKGQAAGFGEGEGIHVGAQGYYAAGLAALQNAYYAGAGHAGLYFQAQALQLGGDELGSAVFLVAQLGVFVDVAPPGHYLELLGCGQLRDAGVEGGILGVGGGCGQGQPEAG